MAKLTKYLIAAAVVVAVAVATVAAAAAGLLAGAVVLLVLVVVALVVLRFQAARQEKAASADWVETLGEAAVTDEDLGGWVPTPARSGRLVIDPSVFASPAVADAADGFEGLTDSALADAGDAPIDWSVPAEWGQGPLPDESTVDEGTPGEVVELTFGDDGDRADEAARHDEPPESGPAVVGDDWATPDDAPGHDGSLGGVAEGPVAAPVEIHESTHAETLSFATAGVSRNGNGLIDWSGPVHPVEEHIHTADDILEASAATALPTVDDRPAPAAGSELARLLAKVEARLRDYE
ncbi:MAG: hypothetical protein MUE36_10050 [Acidimicrobiales bacterium]|nr:hypothetical protein [Acidimicrobiales bacterium]